MGIIISLLICIFVLAYMEVSIRSFKRKIKEH